MIKEEKGFTLTETMVVVVVFTAVMSMALAVFLASIRTQRTALFQQRLTTETSYALNRIAEEIRNGDIGESEITKGAFREFLSSAIEVDRVKTSESGIEDEERITVLVDTKIKVDEKRYIEISLQTTAKKR